MHKSILLVVVIIGVILGSLVIKKTVAEFIFNQQDLETNSSFEFLRGNINQIIKKDGIAKTVDRIDQVRKDNIIDINKCHDLLHLVGHAAYEFNRQNWNIILSPKSDICFYGFEHGVEAQIVFESSDDVNKMFSNLHEYCSRLKNKFSEIYCYHGVGHAFVQEGQPIESALKNCDKVVENTNDDPLDCYRGAFSEYVNRLAAIDGDTNAPIPGITPTKIEKDHAYDICLKLPLKYQKACVAQFTAFIFDGNLDSSLISCSHYDNLVSNICAFKVSEAYTSNNIERLTIINPPTFFAKLPQSVRWGYISGVISGYVPFRSEELFKKASFWCSLMPYKSDRDFCLKGL